MRRHILLAGMTYFLSGGRLPPTRSGRDSYFLTRRGQKQLTMRPANDIPPSPFLKLLVLFFSSVLIQSFLHLRRSVCLGTEHDFNSSIYSQPVLLLVQRAPWFRNSSSNVLVFSSGQNKCPGKCATSPNLPQMSLRSPRWKQVAQLHNIKKSCQFEFFL